MLIAAAPKINPLRLLLLLLLPCCNLLLLLLLRWQCGTVLSLLRAATSSSSKYPCLLLMRIDAKIPSQGLSRAAAQRPGKFPGPGNGLFQLLSRIKPALLDRLLYS